MWAPRFLVEALARLFADPPSLHQLTDDRWDRECVPLLGRFESFGKIGGYVRQNIDSSDVHRPERGALGAAHNRAGHRVDLLDRVLPGLQLFQYPHDPEQPDAVCNEIWGVFRDDHPLAQPSIDKVRERRDDGGDDLQTEVWSFDSQVTKKPPSFSEVTLASF